MALFRVQGSGFRVEVGTLLEEVRRGSVQGFSPVFIGQKLTSTYQVWVSQGIHQDTTPPSFPPGSSPLQTLWALHTRFRV